MSIQGVVEVPSDEDKCPAGKGVGINDCIAAGLAVGGKQNEGLFFHGPWNNRPSGCFVEEIGNKLIYFNENLNPTENVENDSVSFALSVGVHAAEFSTTS